MCHPLLEPCSGALHERRSQGFNLIHIPKLSGSSTPCCLTPSQTPTPPSPPPSLPPPSTPPLASPSIAKPSFPPLQKRSPARTVSCAATKTLSACARRPDDFVGHLPGNRRPLAARVSSIAHVPPCRPASSGLAGMLGAPLPIAHHLDQRRPASLLERRVLSARSL